jgi:E3 ubiquitin-protein transferase RMND5
LKRSSDVLRTKLFKDKPLPSTEYDALSTQPALVNRAVAMHLLREGQFSVAATFLSEVAKKPTPAQPACENPSSPEPVGIGLEMDQMQSGEIRKQFTLMYHILQEMRGKRNLLPAIEWARENQPLLEARGSNLEFELCRLQFVWLFHAGKDPQTSKGEGRGSALKYARDEFLTFQTRHLPEIRQLAGAMVFCQNLKDSPYRAIFNNPSAWTDVASSFTREFCSLLGLSADSPLYIAATAGAIALPTLLKLQTIMKEKRTEWTSQNELPVREIPLPSATLTSFITLIADMLLLPRSKSHFPRHTSSTLSLCVLCRRSRPQTKIRR